MADVSVRGLDDKVKERLRLRAAENGRSMEAEIRTILTEAVSPAIEAGNPFIALYERFQALGGVDLDLPPRSNEPPRYVDFSGPEFGE